MGIKPHEFYDLTPRDIMEFSEGYELSQERKEIQDAHIIQMLLSPHIKKGKKFSLKDFLIKWEKKIYRKKSTRQMRDDRDKVAAGLE